MTFSRRCCGASRVVRQAKRWIDSRSSRGVGCGAAQVHPGQPSADIGSVLHDVSTNLSAQLHARRKLRVAAGPSSLCLLAKLSPDDPPLLVVWGTRGGGPQPETRRRDRPAAPNPGRAADPRPDVMQYGEI